MPPAASPKAAAPKGDPLTNTFVITLEKDGKTVGMMTVRSVYRAQPNVSAKRNTFSPVKSESPIQSGSSRTFAGLTHVATGNVVIRITSAGREVFLATADKATIINRSDIR